MAIEKEAIEKVIKSLAEAVDSIYEIGEDKILTSYTNLLDALENFIVTMSENGYQVDMTKELLRINEAMQKKDYILLADILSYEIKPEFEAI